MSTLEGICLSPQQKRSQALSAWVEVCIHVTGDVDPARLNDALTLLAASHDILRTRFEQLPGSREVLQVIDPEPAVILSARPEGSEPHVWMAVLQEGEGYDCVLHLPKASLDASSLQPLLSAFASCYEGQAPEEVLHYADLTDWLCELEEELAQELREEVTRRHTIAHQSPLPFVGMSWKGREGACDAQLVMDHPTPHRDAAWMATAWSLLLWRHARQSQVTVYSTFENRSYDGFEEVIGPLNNALPMCVQVNKGMPFQDLLMDWSADYRFMEEHQELVTHDHAPVAFSYQELVERSLGAVRFSLAASDLFPLTTSLHLAVREDRLVFNYDGSLFTEGQIHALGKAFVQLLRGLEDDPQAKVDAISLHQPGILPSWSDAIAGWDSAIAKSLTQRPTGTAIRVGDTCWSAERLHRAISDLVYSLKSHGVGVGDIVPILLPRSADSVAAMLAIHVCGAAWLPLAEDTPPERLQFILEDVSASCIVGQAGLLPVDVSLPLIEPGEGAQELGLVSLESPACAEDPAYVIYTSGSTGQPKGVVISNDALSHYLAAVISDLALPDAGHYAHVSTLAADLGHTVLFPPLMLGGTLHLIPSGISSDPKLLGSYFLDHPIDVLKIVPGQMAALLEGDQPAQLIPRQRLIFGGERLTSDLVNHIAELAPRCQVFNHYGPTEATVGVLATEVFPPLSIDPPLGQPLGKAHIEIIEPGGTWAPPGVVGEILIGGPTLASEYWQRPKLTQAAFVGDGSARRYRTGDLGYWLADCRGLPSDVVFVGRADSQVKVRGFRVETGEVEHALRQLPQVQDALVLVVGESPHQRLRAWVIPSSGMDSDGLLEELAQKLPEPMIPDVIIPLEQFPRTANGKIDRKRLPQPETQRTCEMGFANAREETLAALWRDFFGSAQVHANSNFFELGGSSLTGTVLLSRIRKTFGSELSILELFEEPTIRGIAKRIGNQVDGNFGLKIQSASRQSPLPLSSQQERLWVLHRLAPDSTAYNLPAAFEVSGSFSIERFNRAFASVVSRHEILRTRIVEHHGVPMQEAVAIDNATAEYVDLSNAEDIAQRVAASLDGMRHQPFDFSQPLVPRCTILKTAPQTHVLLFNIHHIVTDAWSRELFIKELDAYYRDASISLPANTLHYADYAAASRKEDYTAPLSWWKEQLQGLPTLDLPTDHRAKGWGQPKAGMVPLHFDAQTTQHIQALGDRLTTTPFMTLMAGLQILLARYSGQREFGVGFPVANRTSEDVESMMGLFVNTVVLRANLEESDVPLTLTNLASGVRQQTLLAMDHSQVPYDMLVTDLVAGGSHTGLFQVMFMYQDIPGTEARLGDHPMKVLPCRNTHAKFELTLEIEHHNGVFSGCLEYNAELFSLQTARQLADQYLYLLRHLDPDLPVTQQPIAPQEAMRDLLLDAETIWPPRTFENLVSRFEGAVDRYPQQTALVFGEEAYTYAELDAQANSIARGLLQKGIRPGDLVGLDTARAPQTLINMLGILKAGGAFVPIDPQLPESRIEHMLGTARPALLLGSLPGAVSLPKVNVSDRLDLKPSQEQLAYVLFTSGSTGQPKGVAVSHQAVTNFLDAMAFCPGITHEDRLTAVTPFTFDISILELMLPLGAGATLHLLEDTAVKDGQRLAEASAPATIMQATPATWQMLLQAGWSPRPDLRMLCGGEAMPLNLAEKLTANGATLYNMYGPTETTIWSSLAEIAADTRPHLGKPIAKTQFFLVAQDLTLLPQGPVGQLLIAGEGLAQGYLGDPVKTALAFLPNPFAQTPGERLYRTGDVCRVDAHGHLLFVGRADHQLKVRGFRIEADEVRAQLEHLPGVADAAVLVRDQQLVAFLTAEANESLCFSQASAWRRQLSEALPEYMVPNRFHVLEQMPLNTSGKWDYRALGSLKLTQSHQGRLPQTDQERQLVSIWEETLGITGTTMEDDFFQQGGHSLAAIRLVGEIQVQFGCSISLQSFFAQPTPATLAAIIDEAHGLEPIQPADPPHLLSRGQKRLWIVDRLGKDSGAYHMGGGLHFRGKLNVDVLRVAIVRVAMRHEILLGRVHTDDGEQPFWVIDNVPQPLDVIDVQPEQLDALAEHFLKQPYDLEQGPLYRAKLLRLSNKHHLLLFGVHHIVADDASLRVFVDELSQIYSRLVQGEIPSLQALPIRFVDHAAWEWSRSTKQDVAWWKEHLAEACSHNLPLDHPRTKGPRGGGQWSLKIPAKTLTWMRSSGLTPYVVLLSAYQWMLGRYGGQDLVRVGTSIAGRQRQESQSLIGFFVNTLVMQAKLEPSQSFRTFATTNARKIRQALAHGQAPFEEVAEALKASPEQPLFRAFFVLHSALEAQMAGDWTEAALTTEWQEWSRSAARFDVTLSLTETQEGFEGVFHYDSNLFDTETIANMALCYQQLVSVLCSAPDEPMGDLFIGSAPTQRSDDLTSEKPSLLQMFQQTAARAPQAPCLTSGGVALSFTQVDHWSSNLAKRLPVGFQDVVAVMAHRITDTVVAMLAAFKRGAIFLPIDPGLPKARLKMILDDAKAKCLVAPEQISSDVPWINSEPPACFDIQDDQRFQPVPPSATAYLIYTSGSTGTPKPVAVQHAQITSYLHGLTEQLKPAPGWRYALVSSMSADLGNTVIFAALANQGLLHILPQELVLDAHAAAAYFQEHDIDVLKITPSHYRALLQAPDPQRLVPKSWLILGGESLDNGLVRSIQELQPQCRILNHYGPTETTVGATRAEMTGSGLIAIGQAFRGTSAYVVDAHMKPLSPGMRGELVIGGHQVTSGYRGRPGLTAESFVPDSFGSLGTRVYRTGDLVRQRHNGDLLFLGRIDDQVKIRGFRIEPGEVSAAIRKHLPVSDAAVFVVDEELCAFLATSDLQPSVEALKAELGKVLPDHMIPKSWAFLPELPRNSNGKIDRSRIIELAQPHALEMPETTANLTERQQQLAELWEELLQPGRPLVGSDNFFTLGGDSILAIRLSARARTLGFHLKPADVFDHPTLAQLADCHGESNILQPQSAVVGPVSLTPIQRDFFERVTHKPSHYNQSLLLELEQPLEQGPLLEALGMLTQHHDVLRLAYSNHLPPKQETLATLTPALHWIELDKPEQIAAHCHKAQGSLNLQDGPLWRVLYFHTQEGDQIFFVFHHLLIDTVSWRFLTEDLWSAYHAIKEGRKPRLPLKTTHYQDWAASLMDRVDSEDVANELPFWRQLGESAAPPPNSQQPIHEVLYSTQLDEEASNSLAMYESLEARFLAALAGPLTTDYGPLLVDLESHGRHPFHTEQDLTRTVGWFTSVYPVRLERSTDIVDIDQSLQQIPGNGLGYGLLRHLKGEELPSAWIRFNYAGRHSEVLPRGFHRSKVDPGPARAGSSGYLLDIQVLERPDGLCWQWKYDPQTFDATKVEQWAESAIAALQSQISKEEPTVSADLLDMDTLNDVLSAFED